MTNEQAIKMLKSKMDGHADTSYEWAETIRMAIKALEQQPCEDCVSRQAVKSIMVRWKFNSMNAYLEADYEIDKLPSVTPQPCNDYISRQAVINAIANTCFWLSSGDWNELMECINSVPSVTPQPKTGHWIKYQKPWGGMQGWKCSNCKNHYDISDAYTMIPYNYCPNCGSRMMGAENDK